MPEPSSEAPSAARLRWLAWLLPPVVWLAIAVVEYSKFWAHPTRGVPGGADGIIYVWYVEWIQHALWSGQNPLFSGALNAPVGVNVMWNTALLLPAVLLSPLTALVGPIAVVGGLMTLAPVLAATSAYIVFRALTGRIAASLVAATFYGFGPFFIAQNGHLHLTLAACALPWIFYFGYRLVVLQSATARRDGLGLAVVVSLTMLVSEEVVALAAIIAGVAMLTAAALNHQRLRERQRMSHLLRGLGWTTALTAAVLAIPLGYQFLGPLALHEGIIGSQSLDVTALVHPTAAFRAATASDSAFAQRFPSIKEENTGYLGWLLLIVLAALWLVLLVRRTRFALWWIVTSVVTFLLSLGERIWVGGSPTSLRGPWAALERIPVLESLVPVRFSLISAALIAVLLAFGLAQLTGQPWAYRVSCTVAGFALLTLLPAARYDNILPLQRSEFFATSAVQAIPKGARTAVLPISGYFNSQAQLMYWQISAGLRFDLMAGYSVLSIDGVPYYVAPAPSFANIIQDAASQSRALTPEETLVAQVSVRESGVQYIVITDLTPGASSAAGAAEQVTGCQARRVADVYLCAVPAT